MAPLPFREGQLPVKGVTPFVWLDLGQACMAYHNQNVRRVRVRRLQCDEIWAYVGAKAKNVSAAKKEIGWGDVWTWVGIDADTKLVVSYLVGAAGLTGLWIS